jgi:transcriptional regulator with XRE-family HTH domain
MEIRELIAALRGTLGLSQSALATKLQLLGIAVSQQRVSDWERGRFIIPADALPFLAVALECDPNRLVGWETFRKRYGSV